MIANPESIKIGGRGLLENVRKKVAGLLGGPDHIPTWVEEEIAKRAGENSYWVVQRSNGDILQKKNDQYYFNGKPLE